MRVADHFAESSVRFSNRLLDAPEPLAACCLESVARRRNLSATAVLQHSYDSLDALVYREDLRIERQVWRDWDVVRRAHARKIEQLAGVSPRVAAGLLPRAARVERRCEVDLDKAVGSRSPAAPRSRTAALGATKAQMQISPASFMNRATSIARRRFSDRSAAVNPRPLLMVARISRPSRTVTARPISNRRRSSAYAIVVLPEPGKPGQQDRERPVSEATRALRGRDLRGAQRLRAAEVSSSQLSRRKPGAFERSTIIPAPTVPLRHAVDQDERARRAVLTVRVERHRPAERDDAAPDFVHLQRVGAPGAELLTSMR